VSESLVLVVMCVANENYISVKPNGTHFGLVK